MQRKSLIHMALFLLILIGLLTAASQTLDYGVRNCNSYGQYSKVNIIANHRIDPQIAFFGSSVGEVSLNASLISRQTNRSAFNFCIDGTRFIQYNGLIKEFNSYSVNCELIVFAETFFSLSSINKLTEVDRYLPYINTNTIYTSLHSIQPELMWKLRYVPFYKFIVAKQGYYKSSALGYKEILSGLNRNADSLQGYTPKFMQWQHGLDDLNKVSTPVDIQIDSATLEKYRLTINELCSKGRQVLIIIPPIQDDGLRLMPDLKKLRNAFVSMQRQGVYFRDFSRSNISQEKKYFYNNSHVNDSGARKFSSRLALTIDSILVLRKEFINN